MRAFLIAMILGMASGCATPYQPLTWRHGYTDRYVGRGRWLVRFDGNGFTPTSEVEEYALRRASEICQEQLLGHFELVGLSRGSERSRTPDNIQCNTDRWGRTSCHNYGGAEVESLRSVELLVSCAGRPRQEREATR